MQIAEIEKKLNNEDEMAECSNEEKAELNDKLREL